jgi:hypothetical protein
LPSRSKEGQRPEETELWWRWNVMKTFDSYDDGEM